MTTRKVEYRVRGLSGPGREDAYESPIPIPLARFGQVASVQPQGLKNAFTVLLERDPEWTQREFRNLGKKEAVLFPRG